MVQGRITALVLAGSLAAMASETSAARSSPSASSERVAFNLFVETHCLGCHDHSTKTADLALDDLIGVAIAGNHEPWEKVVRKLSSRQMPPSDMPRPDEAEYDAAIAWLTSRLDAAAAERPNPGRTETFRRLSRTEYQNAIRDLLAVDIDAASLLPADESSHGFDNITVTDLSPTLLSRYISAAQKISRLAVGRAPNEPNEDIFRIRPDVTQDSHVEGLPLGTRGGTKIAYNFPQDGEYEIRVRLMRDRNDEVESLTDSHELEVMLDRARVASFTVKPPRGEITHDDVDAHLKARIETTAGPHEVGVAFLPKGSSLLETTRQPLNVHFNFYRHPRLGPAVYQVSIIGPLASSGPGDTPSRQRLFGQAPTETDDEEETARHILLNLMRRAYRRPITGDDLKKPMELYLAGRGEDDFDAGIELALSAILVNPNFLFRIECDPAGVPSGTAYSIDDVELASRLSFFLWSSIPDDELLDLAARGELGRPEVLEQQARRMLADERSQALVNNFANQWLYLRNLESVTPDMRLYPDFDDNLRQAMRQESELFFASIVEDDRSVLDLIRANYTYLNERLAKHYGIPHVYGSRFRRVALDEGTRRGGLLRHASILTVTSYATRTSPVLRGQWVLKNFVGLPAPPPPPDVPDLEENTILSTLSVRERLQQHRSNEACASCHALIDPVGFALENFDAVGRWRDVEAGKPIDASGGFPDGSEFAGVSGLEQALLDRPELFVRTLTEKLMTFALGRGTEYYDAPAIRKIVSRARDDDYRFSRLIVGIVQSTPFRMRMSQ
ncbi:MAG TPA: DUF1592 domain-containing protein [Lacipirellulaceae bacterium]|nr:DUF1592 domain-containing protein [Lacipirellulaceae bacterium]